MTVGISHVERGMLLMIAATLIVPGLDAIAKALSTSLAPGQIAWSRFAFQAAFLAPLVIFGRRPIFGAHIALQALRGVLISVATLLFFTALTELPLADCVAIFFVEPLILTVLSALFLGETIGWRRMAAVVIGFLGALLIIRPSYAVFGWAAVLPLGAALCFAIYLALTRKLVMTEDALTLQFNASLFGGLTMSAVIVIGMAGEVAMLAPVWPSANEWLALVGLGVIATIAHMLLVFAFRLAPASVLAPFGFLEIISATALGYLVFGDFPSSTTWAGVAIIIGAGLFVFRRERQFARLDSRPSETGNNLNTTGRSDYD